MPRFTADPSKMSAGFSVLETEDDVELIVGEPKPFQRDDKDGKTGGYGVGFSLRVADGKQKGKSTYYNGGMDNEIGQGFTKQFLMACYGFVNNTKSEEEFNTAMAAKDWSYDTTTGEVGEIWKECKGQRVIVNLGQTTGKVADGAMFQTFKKWRPISSGQATVNGSGSAAAKPVANVKKPVAR